MKKNLLCQTHKCYLEGRYEFYTKNTRKRNCIVPPSSNRWLCIDYKATFLSFFFPELNILYYQLVTLTGEGKKERIFNVSMFGKDLCRCWRMRFPLDGTPTPRQKATRCPFYLFVCIIFSFSVSMTDDQLLLLLLEY